MHFTTIKNKLGFLTKKIKKEDSRAKVREGCDDGSRDRSDAGPQARNTGSVQKLQKARKQVLP